MRRVTRVFLFIVGVLPAPAIAQEAQPGEYLHRVPGVTARAVTQTPASARLALYGDASDARYRDEAPRDGIDDARWTILHGLGVRFAPLLVLNTWSAPLALRPFVDAGTAFPLHVDTWERGQPGGELVARQSLDLRALVAAPCHADPARSDAASDDCRLLELLRRYHPDDPASALARTRAREPGRDLLEVLWFDFPGHDQGSWEAAYRDPDTGALRQEYAEHLHTYVHPFLAEVPACGGGRGYELVLQYWFFYPFHDGRRQHPGDWQHVNVVPSPRDRLGCGLPEAEMRALLDGASLASTGPDELVVSRVEYFFGTQVHVLDLTRPNPYLPRAEWETEVRSLEGPRAGAAASWSEVRRRAWADEAGTIINTHPVVHVGGDLLGADQVTGLPGGSHRDEHGNFPFPGTYTHPGDGVGSIRISGAVDTREWLALTPEERAARSAGVARGGAVSLAVPERVTILPDVDRLGMLVLQDPEARRAWSWLLLPVRFGDPASGSRGPEPGLAPLGPAFSEGWNRSGEAGGYANHDPHRVPRLFPTDWQDELINGAGWLNLTAPALSLLPPFDLLWRGVLAPVRLSLQSNDPKFIPAQELPARFFGLAAGVAAHRLESDYAGLVFNQAQVPGIMDAFATYQAGLANPGQPGTMHIDVDDAWSPAWQVAFFLGPRWVSENNLRHSRSHLVMTREQAGEAPFELAGSLSMWEYAGSLRYNLSTGTLKPYVKGGYGLSWYRIEGLAAQGDPLPEPDSPWVRQPRLDDLGSLLPNTWHLGGGLELMALVGRSLRFTKGLDLSVKLDWSLYTHQLGIQEDAATPAQLVALGMGTADWPHDHRVLRPAWSLLGTVSF